MTTVDSAWRGCETFRAFKTTSGKRGKKNQQKKKYIIIYITRGTVYNRMLLHSIARTTAALRNYNNADDGVSLDLVIFPYSSGGIPGPGRSAAEEREDGAARPRGNDRGRGTPPRSTIRHNILSR